MRIVMASSSPQPLFKFGLISDIQWADIPDGTSFHGTPRFYRNALVAARRAVSAFTASKVDLAIHLGDIIDYHNSLLDDNASETALQAAIDCFDALESTPVLHCIGNHCLYNASRPVLNARLGIDAHKAAVSTSSSSIGQHSYFSMTPNAVPNAKYRFIVLDGYDVSLLGWPEGHPLHEQAVQILSSRNPNENKNSNLGLEGLEKRFVKFSGAVSATQLAWLQQELDSCRALGERAIICCHLCLHPATCVPTCLMWNYDKVLQVLQSNADVVVATLSGHAHRDGYFHDVDNGGIHHRVCAGVLETQPGSDCFGIVEVYEDRMVVRGGDAFESGVWEVSPALSLPLKEEEKMKSDTGGDGSSSAVIV